MVFTHTPLLIRMGTCLKLVVLSTPPVVSMLVQLQMNSHGLKGMAGRWPDAGAVGFTWGGAIFHLLDKNRFMV